MYSKILALSLVCNFSTYFSAVMVVCYSVTALVRMIRATGVLHEKMLRNILRGPMSFFDTTPIGRIVNRFSQDIESIDLKIPQSVESFLDCLFVVISTLVIIVYSTPIFASIIVPLMLVYLAIQVSTWFVSYAPVHEKTNNLGLRPGLTQNGLYSNRSRLEP